MSDKPKSFTMVEIIQSFMEFQRDSKISLPRFHASHNECFVGGYNKAWNAAIESMQEEISGFKKENSILRSVLNRLYEEVSNGEHLDKEWIEEAIREEVQIPVVNSALKMYESHKRENLKLQEEIDKRDARIRELDDQYAKLLGDIANLRDNYLWARFPEWQGALIGCPRECIGFTVDLLKKLIRENEELNGVKDE